MFIDIAIKKINPDAEFRITEPDEDNLDTATIDWLNGTTPISNADIQTQMDLLQAEYDALDYARKRKEEYPSIEEAVHAILDDDLENLQILRQAVKNKFPKENS